MGVAASGETKCFCLATETISSAEPIRVVVTGAGSATSWALLPMIAKGDVFGRGRRVAISGYDLNIESLQESMKALCCEMIDGRYPLLCNFSEDSLGITDKAFKDADYAIMLGAYPRKEEYDDKQHMQKNVAIFKIFGRAISNYAKSTCKVLLVNSTNYSSSNVHAFVLSEFVPRLPKENFTTLASLSDNRMAGLLADKAGCQVGDIRNVVTWGRQSWDSFVPDVDHALIGGKPVKKVLSAQEEWLKTDFPKALNNRGENIFKVKKAAPSVARAVVLHLNALHFGSRTTSFMSMGVWSKGNPYSIREGLYYSFPVKCLGKGRYKIYSGLKQSDEIKGYCKKAEAAIIAENKLATEVIERQRAKRVFNS